jgi:hypothetical protein
LLCRYVILPFVSSFLWLEAFGALASNHLRDWHVREGFGAAFLMPLLRRAVMDGVVGSQRMILRALNDVGRGARHFIRRTKTFGDAFSVTWAGSSNFNHGFHFPLCWPPVGWIVVLVVCAALLVTRTDVVLRRLSRSSLKKDCEVGALVSVMQFSFLSV